MTEELTGPEWTLRSIGLLVWCAIIIHGLYFVRKARMVFCVWHISGELSPP